MKSITLLWYCDFGGKTDFAWNKNGLKFLSYGKFFIRYDC